MRILYLLALAAPCAVLGADPSFSRDIRPLLQRNCQGCHQPSQKSAGLDVTTFAGFAAGGSRGPAFRAGAPEDSLTIQYLTAVKKPAMPLGQPALPAEQIDLFRAWIKAGAKDDSPVEAATEMRRPATYSQAPVLTALRFSPDGQVLAVSGNGEILLHKVDGSGMIRRLPGESERLLSLVFSRDGKTLVAGGGTPARFGEVQWWDVAGGKLLRSAKVTNDTVFGATLAPDSSKVAVGCTDNTVHVYESATGRELYKLGTHENWVLGTVFGVDGKRFVSVGRDRAAKLIDASNGAFLENVNLLRGELNAVARHPQKDLVVIGGEERIPYLYTMDRPKNMKIADDTTLVRKFDRQNGPILALDWSLDGRLIAVAGASPEVNLYDPESGTPVCSAKGHHAGIYAVAFTPDSRQFATGGFDGQVRLYDASTCRLLKEFVPVPLAPQTSSLGGAQ